MSPIIRRPPAIGLGRAEFLRKGSLPFFLHTWKCAEPRYVFLCWLFREVLNCLTKEEAAGVALNGMFKKFSRPRLRQQARGYTPPFVLRRAAWPQASLSYLTHPPSDVFMRLHQPLAKLTPIQVAPCLLHVALRTLGDNCFARASSKSFDLLKAKVLSRQTSLLLGQRFLGLNSFGPRTMCIQARVTPGYFLSQQSCQPENGALHALHTKSDRWQRRNGVGGQSDAVIQPKHGSVPPKVWTRSELVYQGVYFSHQNLALARLGYPDRGYRIRSATDLRISCDRDRPRTALDGMGHLKMVKDQVSRHNL